jgi:hypothetical protein
MEKEDRVFIAVFQGMVAVLKIFVWIIRNLFNMGMWGYQTYKQTKPPENYTPPIEVRCSHTHIVAGSGHGKTQLIQNMVMRDLGNVKYGKQSIVIIDSQGDMIRKLLHMRDFAPPSNLSERLVFIDPTDIETPPCLNLFDFGQGRLKAYSEVQQEQLVNGAVSLYEYLFGALLGAELTQRQGVFFRYLARLMMVVPGGTIYTLMDFMEHPEKTHEYLSKLNFSTQKFLTTQFCSPSFETTRRQITMRLWGVLSNATLARMFSHPHNKLNLFEAMNNGSIILINTAKEHLKQEGCEIFGRFMIALITQATQERATIRDENKRMPTFVYIDEAQDYFGEGGDSVLDQLISQGRKYRVGVTLAHQALGQLNRRLLATITSSTATKIVGGLSTRDTDEFAREMQTTTEAMQQVMRKYEDHSDFVGFTRNGTPPLSRMSVSFGDLERYPKITDASYEKLLEANRLRYCAPAEERMLEGVPRLPQLVTVEGEKVSSGFDLEDPRDA